MTAAREAGKIKSKGEVSKEPDETLTLLNDEITRRLDGQRATATQTETKAAALMTLALTGLAFALAHFQGGWREVTTVTGFSISILLGLACLVTRTWGDSPAPDKLITWIENPKDATLDALVRSKGQEFQRNRSLIDDKGDWLKLLTYTIAITAILLFVAVVA